MFNKKKKNNKGFTLVELLVVIAIIGVLAVVAVPSLFKQVDKARATNIVANMKALQTEVISEYANSSDLSTIATKLSTSTELNKIIPTTEIKYGEVYKVVMLKGTAVTDDKTEANGLAVQVKNGSSTKAGILDMVAKQLGVTNDATNGVILQVSYE